MNWDSLARVRSIRWTEQISQTAKSTQHSPHAATKPLRWGGKWVHSGAVFIELRDAQGDSLVLHLNVERGRPAELDRDAEHVPQGWPLAPVESSPEPASRTAPPKETVNGSPQKVLAQRRQEQQGVQLRRSMRVGVVTFPPTNLAFHCTIDIHWIVFLDVKMSGAFRGDGLDSSRRPDARTAGSNDGQHQRGSLNGSCRLAKPRCRSREAAVLQS